jgi:hypothetical protein
VIARPHRLEGPALVKFTVGVVPHPGLAAEVEILVSGIAIGPPALVSLERSKRSALLRRDYKVIGFCGKRRAVIFDHDLSYSIIFILAKDIENDIASKNKLSIAAAAGVEIAA